MSGRAWQRMLSGRRLDLLNPSPFDVDLDDLTLGLSRVSRWNGQTRGAYAFSVAQHLLLCQAILCFGNSRASASLQLFTLLHDASEYVIGDLISPFKAAIGMDYKVIEGRLLQAIFLSFGLPAQPSKRDWQQIKKADTSAAYCEALSLADFSREEADKIFKKPENCEELLEHIRPYLDPVSPQEAAGRLAGAIECQRLALKKTTSS